MNINILFILFIKLFYVLMKVLLGKGLGSFIDTYYYECIISTRNYVFFKSSMA